MSIIRMRGVTRSFGSAMALAGVDFEVAQAQVVGLVGRNGAGKSTLLRLLVPPLMHPTAGEIRVFDLDPWEHQEAVKQRLGYVSDLERMPAGVRVCDLLELCARTYVRWDRQLAERYRARLELDPRGSFNALSQGQQRQVSLLLAIGHRPELLLLDEPTANFDPAVRREFLGMVVEALAESGTTVVMATHLLSDLERLAERLVILHRGRVIADGAIDDFTRGHCRVELAGTVAAEALAAWGTCLHHERLAGATMAVLACSAAAAPEQVRAQLGDAVQLRAVAPLGLEEAFIYRTGAAARTPP